MGYFLAVDKWKNAIKLSADKSINLEVSSGSESVSFEKEILINGVLKTTF